MAVQTEWKRILCTQAEFDDWFFAGGRGSSEAGREKRKPQIHAKEKS